MPTWHDIRDDQDLRDKFNLRDLTSDAIQSQYSASPKMLALMAAFQERLDPSDDMDSFYRNVFDIYTAKGQGLDNWGRIVGIARMIEDEENGKPVSIILEDDYYRLLLLYKALANISPADASNLNRLLHELIHTGIAAFPPAAYVLEVDTMVIRWVFEDWLTPLQRAVFKAAGTLARGAGVGWELYALNADQVFGFDHSGMHPFNQRPFAPDNALITGV